MAKILLFLALSLWTFVFSSPGQKISLFPVDKNGKAGYIDHSGKVIIPLKFDEAWGFAEGLAPVRVGEDWGYIDEKGSFVIKPQFFSASKFSEGLAKVGIYFPGRKIIRNQVGYSNYIDRSGKAISDEQFGVAFSFSEGLAKVLTADYKRVFIDKTGKHVFEFFAYESEIRNGRVLFKTKGNMPESRAGFIDASGKIVISARYLGGENFSEGLACVYDDEGAGFIDPNGNWAIAPTFRMCRRFSEGFAAVFVDGKYGFIDKSGKMVIKPQFAEAERFSDGVAVVRVGEIEKPAANGLRDVTITPERNITMVKDGSFGVIDKTGTFIIPPKFIQIGDFKNGLAWVNLSNSYLVHGDTDRWGYINKQGKIVWKSF